MVRRVWNSILRTHGARTSSLVLTECNFTNCSSKNMADELYLMYTARAHRRNYNEFRAPVSSPSPTLPT